jgi:hypothetical protein
MNTDHEGFHSSLAEFIRLAYSPTDRIGQDARAAYALTHQKKQNFIPGGGAPRAIGFATVNNRMAGIIII